MLRSFATGLVTIVGLCALAPSALAQACVRSDPASSACLMADPNWSAAAGRWRGDPSGYRFKRGPLGGMLDVPEGYFVCGLYDARNRRCLARANTEADMERAVDQGAMLGRELIERREAMMERIGMKPTGVPPPAPRRPYSPGSRIILVEGSGKSEVRSLIDCLRDVHDETLTEASCYDLESALERCTR